MANAPISAPNTDQPELDLLKTPRETRIVYVDTKESLKAATDALAADEGWFAVDAERASGFKYTQRAYLLQIKRTNTPIYLIDPAALAPDIADAPGVFAGLAEVMKTGGWILHAASQDLPCLSELGITCPELFDTELGSRIAGFDKVGLGAVCERLLGLRLAKEHSAVDWSIRPLHPDWLNYAALDVDVLHEMRLALAENLASQGLGKPWVSQKTEWANQEFENTREIKTFRAKVDRWRGLTGMQHHKDQRSLAIARELWLAREALAAKVDVSPGRLIPDASIVAVVENVPRSRPELAGLRSFTGRARSTYLDTWWAAVEKALSTRDLPPLKLPMVGIPNHRNWPKNYPEAFARLEACKAAVAAVSSEVEVPAENILKPDTMREICFTPPQQVDLTTVVGSLLGLAARHWQIELLAEAFVTALQAKPVEPELSQDTDTAS